MIFSDKFYIKMKENVEELIQEAVEVAGVNAELDIDIENELNNRAVFVTGDSVLITRDTREFAHSINEAASLFSTFNKCHRLIESSSSTTFPAWDKLRECVEENAHHPRVSNKMKIRCLLINKYNAKTFALLQENIQLELDQLDTLGKMNLLHIYCDTGWDNLARELVFNQGMSVNFCCPSLHMRPACLTPLMLAVGAGHIEVV